LSLLPIPVDWNRARSTLTQLGERAMHGDVPADDEILGAVLGAYQLCLTDVQLLLSWTAGRD